MWIIPSNHPLYSRYAQECVASKEDLIALSDHIEPSLTWRSKRLSSKTWSDKWKRVYWLPHLFSRTLKISHTKNFTDEYIGSWEVILAKDFQTPAFEEVQTILDTFGRSLRVALKNRGLWEFGSRMSKATYRLAYGTFLRTYENWVIRLRLDYSRRQKSELPTDETGSLFSGWRTPTSSEMEGGTLKNSSVHPRSQYRLRDQVSWPTPETGDIHLSPSTNLRPSNRKKGPKNFHQGVNWTTPVASDQGREGKFAQGGTPLSAQVRADWPTPTVAGNHNSEDASPKAGNGLSTEVKNWGTPRASMLGDKPGKMSKSNLEDQVWPTAQARDFRAGKSDLVGKSNSRPLNEVVMAWTTPQAHDAKLGGNFNPDRDKEYKSLSAEARRNGLPDQENHNMTGKNLAYLDTLHAYQVLYDQCGVTVGRILRKCWERKYSTKLKLDSKLTLNPAWVMQLQGTTLEKTFFAWRAMPWLNNKPNLHSDT